MALLKDQFSLTIQDGFSFYSVANAAVLNYFKPSSVQEEEEPQLNEEQQRAQQNADRARQGRR
jgi:hypothetical protein